MTNRALRSQMERCDVKYKKGGSRDGEECVHHPGVPIFHEGSKGYSCCKRKVLEFDQFLKLEGCQTKDKHMFVGSGKKDKAAAAGGKEVLTTVRYVHMLQRYMIEAECRLTCFDRHDFYQTPSTVIASFFLKKIVKDTAKVEFQERGLNLDLTTSDPTPKHYAAEVPLYGPIDTEKSAFKILGSKLELTLVKADGASWPVLRGDEALTGEILQIGKAGRAT
jgi:hypothetical protein